MVHQSFTLYNPNRDVKHPMPTDFNLLPEHEIRRHFEEALQHHAWDPSQRYVALGSYGDCVIYEDGWIDFVSDSG